MDFLNKPTSNPKLSGFTLLEVMVALVVIALALGALMQTTANQTRQLAYLRDKTIAHWVALNVLATMQIEENYPSTGKKTGEETMLERTWYWQAKVEKLEDETLQRLEIKIFSDKKREQTLTYIVSIIAKE